MTGNDRPFVCLCTPSGPSVPSSNLPAAHAAVVCSNDENPQPSLSPAVGFVPITLFGVRHIMSEKIKMRAGDTMLIMVQGGEVIHFTPNMSLPHSEFAKRATGQLPAGAWVGTVSKPSGEVAAISSKHFFGYQLPAPPEVWEAVRRRFE